MWVPNKLPRGWETFELSLALFVERLRQDSFFDPWFRTMEPASLPWYYSESEFEQLQVQNPRNLALHPWQSTCLALA